MIVEFLIDAARLRRWHLDLAERVRRERPGCAVQFRLGTGRGLPLSVTLLITLENLLHRLPAPRPTDRAEPGSVSSPRSGDRPDLIVDFGAGEDSAGSAGVRRLRLLYDGQPDEGAIFSALLVGRAPLIEIEDAGERRILAQGLPSTENAPGVAGGYEAVAARVGTLLVQTLRRPVAGRVAAQNLGGGTVRGADAARFAARSLATAAARRLYHLCFHAPHWKIGWRFVDGGDVWDRRSLDGAPWSVLPDPGDRFYADPVPFVWRGQTYVFCEDLDHRTQKGVISVATFDERGPATPMQPVLEEPWHLSYPFLIEHGGQVFMIPESSANRTVTLYRAAEFPWRWVPEARLLDGIEASDATVVRHAGRFWMFASTRDGAGAYSDTLSIFMAHDLFGPWRPHPGNPILVDAASARPAGNVVLRDGRLWRPVQDCRRGYGAALGLAEIVRLDEDDFGQVVRGVLHPDEHWPGRKLHTLNRAGDLETIDGSGYSPKVAAIAPAVAGLSRILPGGRAGAATAPVPK